MGDVTGPITVAWLGVSETVFNAVQTNSGRIRPWCPAEIGHPELAYPLCLCVSECQINSSQKEILAS
jgi:hypothetical protein